MLCGKFLCLSSNHCLLHRRSCSPILKAVIKGRGWKWDVDIMLLGKHYLSVLFATDGSRGCRLTARLYEVVFGKGAERLCLWLHKKFWLLFPCPLLTGPATAPLPNPNPNRLVVQRIECSSLQWLGFILFSFVHFCFLGIYIPWKAD